MKVKDLDPHWVGAGGEDISDKDGNPVPERHGVGMSFDCPCGCGSRGYVDFTNPLDGGPPHRGNDHHWQRTGDDFETITLAPSILRIRGAGGCGWHGWFRNGEVVQAG